jgi:hypothetical protein
VTVCCRNRPVTGLGPSDACEAVNRAAVACSWKGLSVIAKHLECRAQCSRGTLLCTGGTENDFRRLAEDCFRGPWYNCSVNTIATVGRSSVIRSQGRVQDPDIRTALCQSGPSQALELSGPGGLKVPLASAAQGSASHQVSTYVFQILNVYYP